MKRLFTSAVGLLIPLMIFASRPAPVSEKNSTWHEGYVVMLSGDTVHCSLQFTRKVSEGLIQIRKGNQIEILTVKDVASFCYFDGNKNHLRKFYSVPFQTDQSNKPYRIFIEYVYGNQRLWLVNHRTFGFNARWQFNPFRKKTVVNNRYLFDHETGKVLPMSKDNVLLLMGNQKIEVLNYIKENGIRLKTVDDFIALLDFHQTLL